MRAHVGVSALKALKTIGGEQHMGNPWYGKFWALRKEGLSKDDAYKATKEYFANLKAKGSFSNVPFKGKQVSRSKITSDHVDLYGMKVLRKKKNRVVGEVE